MLYDCFTFFNETELLRLRLLELWEVVDRFVIVEATTTFTGQRKPLAFAELASTEFREFRSKIIHVVVDDMPRDPNPWINEFHLRNAISRGLSDKRSDDWVLVSDVDEIPRSNAVKAIKQSALQVAGLRMSFSYFRFNFLCVEGDERAAAWTVASRAGLMPSPQTMRNSRRQFDSPEYLAANAGRAAALDHAGWHFSYLGDEERVRAKLRTGSHQEYNRPDIVDTFSVQRFLRTGEDVFARPGYRWEVTPLVEYFPAEIRRDPARYEALIAPVPTNVR